MSVQREVVWCPGSCFSPPSEFLSQRGRILAGLALTRLLAAFLVVLAPPVHGGAPDSARVTLAWDAVSDPGLAGYSIYYGTASGTYTAELEVGNTNQATVFGLTPGTTYFFAMTTRLVTGLERDYSSEIQFQVPLRCPVLQPPLVGDGQIAFRAAAPAGHTYDILATQDFVTWVAIASATSDISQAVAFNDPDAAKYPARFYQLHDITGLPPGLPPFWEILAAQNGGAELQIYGEGGHSYEVFGTTDYQVWGAVGLVTVGRGGVCTAACPGTAGYPLIGFSLVETTYQSPPSLIPLTFTSVLPGAVQLAANGLAGSFYHILESGDLSTWSVLGTTTPDTTGLVLFTDLFEVTPGPRYYQLQVAP